MPDTLSRAPLEESDDAVLETASNVSLCAINDNRLSKIRDATEHDESLKRLGNTIMSGWPENKASLPQSISVYFNDRDELSV